MSETITVIGAGHVGGALAQTFTRHGYTVRLGTRSGAGADDVVAGCLGRAATVPVAGAAADAAAVFLCVPADAAVDALRALGDVDRAVVVDCTNPVRWDDGPVWAPPAEGSVAAALAAARPEARVVKGFNTFGAAVHADPSVGGQPAEVLLAGDDGTAVEAVGAIAAACGFAPIHAGPLRNAALLEAMAVLWIHLAMVGGQGREFVFRLARR